MAWYHRFIRKTVIPNCAPNVLLQGATWLYQEKKEVRFPVRQLKPGWDHIQTQVFGIRPQPNKWQWSVMIDGVVQIGREEFPEGRIYKTLTWLELLKERVKAEKQRLKKLKKKEK